ncbi:unnamed protein product, partial [Symbiodinium microadriaticum]
PPHPVAAWACSPSYLSHPVFAEALDSWAGFAFTRHRTQRSRVRKALKEGRSLSRAQLRGLALHHATTAEFRSRLSRMGKKAGKGTWGSQSWDYATYSAYPEATWNFWPGAWSPPAAKGRDRYPTHMLPQFPSYDDQARVQALTKATAAQAAKSKGRGKSVEDADMSDPADTVTQFLQEAINTTRKTEQKMRSLTATRARKETLWVKYVEDMKRTLQKEHQRHQKEMERLNADLHVAAQAQEQARDHLRHSWEAIAAHGQPPPVAEAARDTSWDNMLEAWQAEQQDSIAPQAILRRALQGALPAAVAAKASATHDELFHTPPRKSAPMPSFTPPPHAAMTPPGLSRTTDPYMTSPGQPEMPSAAAMETHQDAETAGPDTSAPRSRPKSTDPRTPVKKLPVGVTHTTAHPHSDIADKLNQKRAQILEGGAMNPFRIAPAGTQTLPRQEEPPPARNLLEECEIVETDDEDLPPPPSRRRRHKLGAMHLLMSAWLVTPVTVSAMARPEVTGEPTGPPPWDLQPEPLPVAIGLGQPDLPWADAERAARAQGIFRIGDIPWQPNPAPNSDEDQWLGVYVYAPHFQTIELAVRANRQQGSRPILDAIIDSAPGTPDRLFQCAVPVVPQRCAGYLHVIRYSSILGGLSEPCSAVMLDLTHVGGRYFATVLPTRLAYHSLIAFLRPFTSQREAEICLYVGARARPWPTVAEVVLRHGDAITAYWGPQDPRTCVHPEELFRGSMPWGPMQHFQPADRIEAVGVLHNDRRYCLLQTDIRGESVEQAVMRVFRLDPASVTLCTFPTAGLEIQGHACSTVVAVADRPIHPADAPPVHRQDIFTYCDLRPLGLRPRFVRTNVPALHLPTLASDFGVYLPPAFRLGVVGGHRRGDTVRLRGNSTLLFFPEEVDSDASSSDTPAQPEHQPSPDTTTAWEVDLRQPSIAAPSTWGEDTFGTPEASYAPTFVSAAAPPSTASHSHQPSAEPSGPPIPEDSDAMHMNPWQLELSYYGLELLPPNAAGEVYVVEHQPTPDVAQAAAYVYAPDFSPVRLELQLPLPCSVSEAVAAVSDARSGDVDMYFPTLHPVVPQPFPDMLITVAAPSWLSDRVVVFFDCRRIDGTMFSSFVHPSLRVGSLLLAAGHSSAAALDVYAHGLIRPLPVDQLVELVSGMLLTLVPSGCGAPATSDLANRLQTTEGWGQHARVPPPHHHMSLNYLVLTEGMPRIYSQDVARVHLLHEDLAHALSSPEHLLTIVHAAHTVAGCFVRGHYIHDVVVASQQLRRLPYPPARVREDRQILLLDCRFVLQSFHWLLLDSPSVLVQEIVNLFQRHCPAGHIVSVIGAPVRSTARGAVFDVLDGTVLIVSFVEDLLPSDESGPGSPPPRPEDQEEDGDGDTRPGPGPAGANDSPFFGRNTRQPASRAPRPRSRTPRPVAATELSSSSTLADATVLVTSNAVRDWVNMWFAGFLQHALAESPRLTTPIAQSSAQLQRVGAAHFLSRFFSPNLWYQLVREFALFLQALSVVGFAPTKPMIPGPSSSSAPYICTEDAPPSDSDTESEQLVVNAAFVLLTPDYSHEAVEMDILIPQPLQELIDLVEVCRGELRKQLFPRLIPVFPQPDVCWGTLLALPAWVDQTVVVCLNTYALQGSLFAATAPPVADRYRLLLLAGLPLSAPVNLYRPGSSLPIQDGEEVQLHTGDCITFCAPGTRPEPAFSLATMVDTHLPWASGPPFPAPAVEARYCVVSDQGHCGFKLLPERSLYYKAVLAQLLHLRPSLLALQPAQPAVDDAVDYGWPCVTVVAAGENIRQDSANSEQVGLLDCRPLLSGWHRLTTRAGWISLEPIRAALSLHVPTGWTLSFSDCRPHWTWTWLSPGQVLVATFVPSQDLSTTAAIASPAMSSRAWAQDDYVASPDTGLPAEAEESSAVVQTAAHSPPTSRPAGRSRKPPPREMSGHSHSPPACHGGRLRTLLCATLLAHTRGMQASPTESQAMPSANKRPSLPPRRPVPTPLRRLVLNTRPVARPPVARERAEPDFHPPLQTLLQEAAASPDCTAMFLASTLLETLFEHFGSSSVFTPREQVDPAIPSGRVVSLEATVQVTPYQRQCLALAKELPHSSATPATDWLDKDLDHVLSNKRISLDLRTRFLNLPDWHQAGNPSPQRLLLYTDGSASADPDDVRPASWAFAVFARAQGVDYFVGQAASVTAPPSSAYHLGELKDDALTGELLAACWGLGWAAEHAVAYGVPVDFYYDSQCAGGGIFGLSKPPSGQKQAPYARLASFAVALRQYASARVHLTHDYVPSHTGQLGNELADALAKTARQQTSAQAHSLLPTWVPRFSRHVLRDWAWAMVPGHLDFPRPYAFESEAHLVQEQTLRPRTAPTEGLQVQSLPEAQVTFTLHCVSFNALTLRDPKHQDARLSKVGLSLMGRKAVLKHSLEDPAPHLVGLQETRLQASEQQPDADYFIFNAEADDRGVGGCSLWLSKNRPYGFSDRQPLFFQEADVTVLSTSPRHLTANILTPRLRLHVQVAHAPYVTTSDVTQAKAFWAARTSEVLRRPSGTDFILLCDANSRLGGISSLHVGDHQSEEENSAGTLFHEFLAQISGFVPATFSDFHQGPGHTWCSPLGHWSRIDYVVFPLSWQSFNIVTRTLPDVEVLQRRDDHVPVFASVTFVRLAPAMTYTRNVRKAVRPPIPKTTHERSQVRQTLARVSPLPWTLDVDTHHKLLTSSWRHLCATPSREATPTARQPFLSEDTLSVIQLRRALRHYLRQEFQERQRRWQMLVLAAFRHCAGHVSFHQHAPSAADAWMRQMDYSEAQALHALHLTCQTVRRKVAADRASYLAQLADQAAACSVKDASALYRDVRKAFPAARPSRRSAYKPLPSLRLADGTPAATQEERHEGWRSHFALQEAGTKVTADEYAAHFDTYSRKEVWRFDIQAVPSLRQVETVIHSLHARKAVGSDSISGELLRSDVPSTSRQLLPILAKASIRAFEPVAFRGGDLFLLAKRASKILGCDAYRSILISSVPGKVYHRCLRQQLLPAFDNVRHPFHAGILAGQGIELISLTAKTFFATANAGGSSAALLFFDLKAAFYQVIRQTLVDTRECDSSLLELFHHLQLPPAAVVELRQKLSQVLLLAAAGVSGHTRALIADLFQGTYFRLTCDSILTLTRRGTRPGDPAADLLFAFTLSAYLQSAMQALRSKDLLAQLPVAQDRPAFLPHRGQVQLSCPAWADDFFFPQTGSTFPALLTRVQGAAVLLTAHASSAGMTVKFGVDKTAVLLPAELLSRHEALLSRDSEGVLGVPAYDEVREEAFFLPAVHTYRHLGGILTSDASPAPDLYFRFAQSMGVVRPLRRKLFGALRFDLQVRRTLLRSLAVSRYVHTAAALLLHANVHRRLWERQYMAIWRVLVARNAVDVQAHCYEVLRQAQAPSPALALAVARAACLRKLFTDGPAELLTFLWDHWQQHPKSSWLAQLEEDVRHVAVFRPEALRCLGFAPFVPAILDSFSTDPWWWSSQVKSAVRQFQADLEDWKAKRLRVHTEEARLSPSPQLPYACYLCTSAFKLRKHLHAHLARAHQIFSPGRHFALSEECPCCLKRFPDVLLAQLHLKRSPDCLLHCLRSFRPLTLDEIRAVEAPARAASKAVLRGKWQNYRAKGPPRRAPIAYGPPIPTGAERATGSTLASQDQDQVPLSELGRPFEPKAAHTVWVQDFIRGRSKEGIREASKPFWLTRPSFHPEFNACIFGTRHPES